MAAAPQMASACRRNDLFNVSTTKCIRLDLGLSFWYVFSVSGERRQMKQLIFITV